MNPGNDVFKTLRCQAIVEALGEKEQYPFCNADYLVFEGQEEEWIEELRAREYRNSCPDDIVLMRREGVDMAIKTMRIGVRTISSSTQMELAADICHQMRIINEQFRDHVANKIYDKMKKDYQVQKRYMPGWKPEKDWTKLQENVGRNDAFESKPALMHRRFNGAHCSYFHR
eukprot:57156-Amphidinium_carterae.1